MNLSKKCLFSACIVAGLVSCSQDTPMPNSNSGSGVLRLALKTNADVSVSQAKTKAGSESIDAPDASAFRVSLTKADNSFSKSWNSVDDFNAEDGFLSGLYNVEAIYGDINDEGFEKPHFYASAQVSVLEDKTTNISMTATLANSMVSINYTDDFKKYFVNYAARIHSEGHSYIDFPADETRPAFVAPGNVELFVDIDKGNGNKTTLQPASFNAKPRHHYTVNFDIAGGVGDAVLKISFEDDLIGESVEIDLTDELFTTPAPEINPSGFNSGDSFEFIEGAGIDKDLRFNVVARAGLSDAVFTVVSDNFTPAFGNEVNLCGASPYLQQQLSQAGLKALGFYKNPENCRLGYLDFKDFTKNLPAGTHNLTFLVKDKFTRASQPVSVTLTSEPVSVKASCSGVVYGATETTINIESNSSSNDGFSFEAMDDYGIFVPCEIVSKSNLKTKALPTANYSFRVRIPECKRESLTVRVYFGNVLKQTLDIPILSPEYDLESDAFANKAYIRVKSDSQDITKSVVDNMKVFVVGPSGSKRRTRADFTIARDPENDMVIISNLEPETHYKFNTTVFSGANPEIIASAELTTEKISAVPNGDFENLGASPSISLNNIDQSGKFTITTLGNATQYQITTSISAFEPVGWASVNKKTCSNEASNKNTWFTIPSTYASNINWTVHHPACKVLGIGDSAHDAVPSLYNAIAAQSGSYSMIVRNVGYSLNGSTPAVKKQTGNTDYSNYFNSNVPTSYSTAVGKLFLGSYSFSGGSETFNEGVDFGSRPSALTGYYKYAPDAADNSELATVTVQILNGNTVIGAGSATLAASEGFTPFSVPVNYSKLFLKATSLRIMFSSSNRNDTDVKVSAHSNKEEASFYGAILTVDNLSFEY